MATTSLSAAALGDVAIAAPARSAGLAPDLLAASSGAVIPVLRTVRRHHIAGSSRRRGTRRGVVRVGDCLRRDRAAGRFEAPWHIDRSLRHLLTDITGNTHRAEFCIDKLYSPDSARGRLGLLELRGFEMPPHFQMAMVQSLLVRALVARFWAQPLSAPLIRHGANLHGRYLLPHFIIHDIAQVAADLRAHDIAFETSWLDPFTEFRFPRIGTAVFDGIEIELRGAIEPWRVLGEEATSGGTARYVDSSIERVQVRVIGADRSRYVVTCNGEPIPLLSTENPDVQVAGVGIGLGSRQAPCTRVSPSTILYVSSSSTRPTRCLGAAAPTTFRTRAAAPTTILRSMPWPPRRAAVGVSMPPVTPPGASICQTCARNKPACPPTPWRQASWIYVGREPWDAGRTA